MTSTHNKNHTVQIIPFQIKVSAVIIIVTSIIGVLFYSTVSIYQLYNPHFLNNAGFNSNQYSNLDAFVIIQTILHFALLLSALLIKRLKKSGLYLYFISFLLLLVTGFIFNSEFILTYIIVGLLIGIIVTISIIRHNK